ncbi:MAG: hypothetical protein O6702_06480 [Candidatus Dadabacteria bacterium]|jgi:hypothetical protein|nr:hypothetical protein [Candidatus Dadabacteria bacterium]MCH8013857.1 hypothetical protein [Candidatus Dadabacteria bacterium]MCZ6528356.1 hypothetical protein [Candidatus Dadabacteria bacterium]MCZ6556048.1 hypothetical protein [Candidatus Dadabacteria bacterium]TDI90160.1 MAG: hypothetical protein E2O72_04845 [Candidatus Dadabacteria bacterium]
MNDNPDIETLDTYIRKVGNQEIKGILLKLKNEIRKSDVTWESVKNILISLEQKDSKSAKEIFLLLLEKTE